jgi:hypothetical protein
MIKKILTVAVLIGLNLTLVGQTCQPDTSVKSPGYFPADLDTAIELSMYSMTVQVHSTRDTLVDNPFGGGQIAATIDSIIVDGVTGLPPGISYICNPSNCRFVSLKTHCINLFGTPTQGSAGNYPMVISVTAKATLAGGFKTSVTEQIRNFSIVVRDDNISSNQWVKANDGIKIYPNPSKSNLNIENLQNINGVIQVYNAEGKEIEKRLINGSQKISMNNERWVSGIYTIRLTFADGSVSHTQINKL